jgi:hypothetical protein
MAEFEANGNAGEAPSATAASDAADTLAALGTALVRRQYKRNPLFDTPRVCANCKVAFTHKGQYSGHLRTCTPESPWKATPTRRHNEILLHQPTIAGLVISRIQKKPVASKTQPRKPHKPTSKPPPSEAPLASPEVATAALPRRRVKGSKKIVNDTLNALLEHSRECYALEDLLELDQSVQYMNAALVRMHMSLSQIIHRHSAVEEELASHIDNYPSGGSGDGMEIDPYDPE